MPVDVDGELGPLQLVKASNASPHAVMMNLLIVDPFKWLVTLYKLTGCRER
jgi:hypothetical protein